MSYMFDKRTFTMPLSSLKSLTINKILVNIYIILLYGYGRGADIWTYLLENFIPPIGAE